MPDLVLALEDFAAGAQFLWRLPSFLRHPITASEARAVLERDLDRREANFLNLVHRAICSNGASPYRKLLDLAGCEYADLERLVMLEGVEGALQILFRRGIYLTSEEVRGRRPVVRGSASFTLDPHTLRNPGLRTGLSIRSPGSSGPRAPVPIGLEYIRANATDICLVLQAYGASTWVNAVWAVPGSSTISGILNRTACGLSHARWFSQVRPDASGLHQRYRWSGRALGWAANLAGVRLPRPQFVPPEDPQPIARWMLEVLQTGGTPCLYTYASAAVLVCQAAARHGLDLRGAKFRAGGEPLTPARLEALQRIGAEALTSYANIEAGTIGMGCRAPLAPDDIHLFHNRLAVIQPGGFRRDHGLPPNALLTTSLVSSARLVLLNASLGDQAVLTERACGCPLEQLGWAIHLHSIRSFEKLTAGGMTFLDVDVIRVLEDLLPARFGGGPMDYQLVEEETPDGLPSLRLLVDPAVGPLDEATVAETFLSAIGGGSGAERVMELQWRGAGHLRVERKVPITSPSGKILHLHRAEIPPKVASD